MDWSWLNQVLAWIVAVNNAISNFAAVIGFLTLLLAGGTYVLRQVFRDPFGDIYRRGPRYERFFVSLAQRIHSKDRSLVPQDIDRTNYCQFLVRGTSKADGASYWVYFVDGKRLQVYLSLKESSSNGAGLYKRLWDQQDRLEKRLGLTKRFLRKPIEGTLVWEPSDPTEVEATGRAERKVIVKYPEPVAIDDDAKKLKELRGWCARELVALRRAIDEILADTSKSPASTPVAALAASPLPATTSASQAS